MPFDILTFVVDRAIARNQGTSDQRATQLGVVGAVLPLGLVPNILVTRAIAGREAAPAAPVVAAAPVATVQVPDVVGKDEKTAMRALTRVGLKGTVGAAVESISVAKDLVVAQSPPAEQVVAAGITVTLHLSKGFHPPDVKSLKSEEAEDQLRRDGLRPNIVKEASDAEKEGKVIKQKPEAGDFVSMNDEVTLTVGAGPDKAAQAQPPERK
jgi:beta-lactam-binding protein with PASTA domain